MPHPPLEFRIPEDCGYLFTLTRIPGHEGESSRIFAQGRYHVDLTQQQFMTMPVVWGAAADWYQVHFQPGGHVDTDWLMGSVALTINGMPIGRAPLPYTLYVGGLLDEPSMLVKFPENYSPNEEPAYRGKRIPPGVWALTGLRIH